MSMLLRRAMMSAIAGSQYDPYFEQVVALLHMEGANAGTVFVDSSNTVATFTAGGTGVTTSTTSPKVGTSSFSDGGSGQITAPSNTVYNANTGDFTVEFWLRTTANTLYVWGQSDASITASSIGIYGSITGTGKYRAGLYIASSPFFIDSSTTVNTGADFHIAHVRINGVEQLFINGVSEGTLTASGSVGSASSLGIGSIGDFTSSRFNGNLDEFRFTRNVARYTTTFTPPTAAFGNLSGNAYATWNPADKAGTITLSGGNLVISGSKTVRATLGKSTGKWFWESTVGGTTVGQFGIANASAALTNWLGVDANGWGYGSDGKIYTNNPAGTAYGATYTTGDVIGMALDMGAGTLTYYKNGVSQGVAFTGLTGTLYPAVGGNVSSASTTNFGATPFKYTIPAGFNPGLF